jgi:hypothetical protein
MSGRRDGQTGGIRLKSSSNFAVLSFTIQPFEGELAVTPLVDGVPLPEITSRFESEHRFEPVGGYGGLIPSDSNLDLSTNIS